MTRPLLRKINTAVRIARTRVKSSMTEVLDISRADRVPLESVFSGSERVGRSLMWARSAPIKPRPMLWPSSVEAIAAPHQDQRQPPDIDLFFVRDAIVGGRAAHVWQDGKLIFARGVYPNYVRHWFDQRLDQDQWDTVAPVGREIDTAFVVTHFNYVWGHFLTEMYPKVFVIKALHRLGIVAPVLVSSATPGWVMRVLRHALPDHEFITYSADSETVRVKRLLMPHMLHEEYAFHEALNTQLDRQADALASGPPRKLFVSRRSLATDHAFRLMTNREEIEGIAREMGLEAICPETLSWEEQIAAFGSASVVVGEFGSGLHNAMFARAGCKVMALNWIVDVQSRIANFRRQDVGYLLPPDGAPRVFTLERTFEGFTIDPAAFRSHLQLVIDQAERQPLPRYEDVPILPPPA